MYRDQYMHKIRVALKAVENSVLGFYPVDWVPYEKERGESEGERDCQLDKKKDEGTKSNHRVAKRRE